MTTGFMNVDDVYLAKEIYEELLKRVESKTIEFSGHINRVIDIGIEVNQEEVLDKIYKHMILHFGEDVLTDIIDTIGKRLTNNLVDESRELKELEEQYKELSPILTSDYKDLVTKIGNLSTSVYELLRLLDVDFCKDVDKSICDLIGLASRETVVKEYSTAEVIENAKKRGYVTTNIVKEMDGLVDQVLNYGK